MSEYEITIFFEKLGADGSIRSKWIIKKQEKPLRAGPMWLRQCTLAGFSLKICHSRFDSFYKLSSPLTLINNEYEKYALLNKLR